MHELTIQPHLVEFASFHAIFFKPHRLRKQRIRASVRVPRAREIRFPD